MSDSDTTPETTETKRTPRNGYLPVLPEHWDYTVSMSGPGGSVRVMASDHEHPERGHIGAVVIVRPVGRGEDSRPERTLYAPTFPEGVKVGVDAAKALARLGRVEREYHEARQAVLATFDEPDEGEADPDAPHVEEPVAAGDLTKDDSPESLDEADHREGTEFDNETDEGSFKPA